MQYARAEADFQKERKGEGGRGRRCLASIKIIVRVDL